MSAKMKAKRSISSVLRAPPPHRYSACYRCIAAAAEPD